MSPCRRPAGETDRGTNCRRSGPLRRRPATALTADSTRGRGGGAPEILSRLARGSRKSSSSDMVGIGLAGSDGAESDGCPLTAVLRASLGGLRQTICPEFRPGRARDFSPLGEPESPARLLRVQVLRAVNALLRPRRLFHLHRIEVSGDDGLGVLVGGADDPQDEEEGHHCRHEVGEGDLPRPAVMLVLERAAPSDDDDLLMIGAHRLRSGVERSEQVRPWAQLGGDLGRAGLDDRFDALVSRHIQLRPAGRRSVRANGSAPARGREFGSGSGRAFPRKGGRCSRGARSPRA